MNLYFPSFDYIHKYINSIFIIENIISYYKYFITSWVIKQLTLGKKILTKQYFYKYSKKKEDIY